MGVTGLLGAEKPRAEEGRVDTGEDIAGIFCARGGSGVRDGAHRSPDGAGETLPTGRRSQAGGTGADTAAMGPGKLRGPREAIIAMAKKQVFESADFDHQGLCEDDRDLQDADDGMKSPSPTGISARGKMADSAGPAAFFEAGGKGTTEAPAAQDDTADTEFPAREHRGDHAIVGQRPALSPIQDLLPASECLSTNEGRNGSPPNGSMPPQAEAVAAPSPSASDTREAAGRHEGHDDVPSQPEDQKGATVESAGRESARVASVSNGGHRGTLSGEGVAGLPVGEASSADELTAGGRGKSEDGAAGAGNSRTAHEGALNTAGAVSTPQSQDQPHRAGLAGAAVSPASAGPSSLRDPIEAGGPSIAAGRGDVVADREEAIPGGDDARNGGSDSNSDGGSASAQQEEVSTPASGDAAAAAVNGENGHRPSEIAELSAAVGELGKDVGEQLGQPPAEATCEAGAADREQVPDPGREESPALQPSGKSGEISETVKTVAPEQDADSDSSEDEIYNSSVKTDHFGFFMTSERRGLDLPPKVARKRRLKECHRVDKWRTMIDNFDAWQTGRKGQRLRKRVRKGVPDCVRGKVWQMLMGSTEMMEKEPNMYGNLVASNVPVDGPIEEDIPRTMYDHEMFCRKSRVDGRAMLRRVLTAYGRYDREVQYCQGINYICALFLLYMPEENAFWLLVASMQRARAPLRELFLPGMVKAQEFQYVVDSLTSKYCPKLSAQILGNNLTPAMYATQWFLTAFTQRFPYDLVTRVWDIFFMEDWKIFYRLCLALFKSVEEQAAKLDLEHMNLLLRNMPSQADAEEILGIAADIPLKHRHIEKRMAQFHALNRARATGGAQSKG